MKLPHIAHNLKYAFNAVVLGRPYPYLTGVVITDRCNLDCNYCLSKNKGVVHAGFDELTTYMRDAYNRGVRYIYFTGGEPTLWTDNGKNLKGLTKAAFDIGFFDVFIATNGTSPLDIPECLYYISMDGPRIIHNAIKNNSFDKIIENINHSSSDRVFLTITLTRENHMHLEAFAHEVIGMKRVKGVLVNFFTGETKRYNLLGLSQGEKKIVIDRLLALKKTGFPLHVSASSLKAAIRNDWPRPIPALELYFNRQVFVCCRDVGNESICYNCGYVSCIEVAQIMRLSPGAILSMLRI